MDTSNEQAVKTPTEARAGEKKGIVWKILAVSVVLAVIAMVAIGQGTDTVTGDDGSSTGTVQQ